MSGLQVSQCRKVTVKLHAGAESVRAPIHGEGSGEEDSQQAEPTEAGVSGRPSSGAEQQLEDRPDARALACTDAPGRLLGQLGHPLQPSHTGTLAQLLRPCSACRGQSCDCFLRYPGSTLYMYGRSDFDFKGA